MTENIQHLKLVNGDELIGDVVGETDTVVCVDFPMILDNWMDPNTGSSGVVLNRFCSFGNEHYVELKRADVTLNYPVHDAMKGYYYACVKASDKVASRLFDQLVEATDTMNGITGPVVSDATPTRFIHKGNDTPH